MEIITAVFLLTSAVIILTPGQDMILVMSRSITQGSSAGIVTAMGVSLGLIGHTLLAAMGLGALLLASEQLFKVVKWIGAGYLVYIGYQLLTSQDHTMNMHDLPRIPYRKMFLQGALSSISNPKVAIFYFSYLPQFVQPGHGNQTAQLLILGIAFALLTFAIKGSIGFISGKLAHWIQTRPSVLKYVHRTSGAILIGLGLRLAMEKRG
jgi:threonine/homoserine/homoserine lactone efflux protein